MSSILKLQMLAGNTSAINLGDMFSIDGPLTTKVSVSCPNGNENEGYSPFQME